MIVRAQAARAAILSLAELPQEAVPELAQCGPLLVAASPAQRLAALTQHGAEVRVLVTTGIAGPTSEELDRLPGLELICWLGVEREDIDLAPARRRGISVCHAPAGDTEGIADHAFALVLGTCRQLLAGHHAVVAGQEQGAALVPQRIHGKRIGIVGLQEVGRRVAIRAGGFDMEVGYDGPPQRTAVPYKQFSSTLALARWCDVLLVAAASASDSGPVADAQVLAALGPTGWLVNVARGHLIDQVALVQALRAGALGGAALDLDGSEVALRQELVNCPNLLLSPNLAARSRESVRHAVDLVVRNIVGHFSGTGLVTPVS